MPFPCGHGMRLMLYTDKFLPSSFLGTSFLLPPGRRKEVHPEQKHIPTKNRLLAEAVMQQ